MQGRQDDEHEDEKGMRGTRCGSRMNGGEEERKGSGEWKEKERMKERKQSKQE